MLVANLSTPLLGIVDTALLGHLEHAIYLAAVALGAQVVTLAFWSFGFLRMATTGFAARALGINDNAAMGDLLTRGLGFAAIASIAILALNPVLSPLILTLMTPETDLYRIALQYTQIRFWSAPATLASYVLIGWLVGLQKTRHAMIIILCTNALNILLDYLLIVEFEMHAQGAAWATLLSEYVGLTIAAWMVARLCGKMNTLLNWSNIWLAPKQHLQYLSASRHLFLRTLCLLFCFTFFAARGAQFGDNVVAANAILLSLLALTALAMDAFAYAAETLGGEAWSKNKNNEFKRIIIYTWGFAWFIALLCPIILILGQQPILALYTNIPAVTQEANQHYLWLAWMPLLAIHSYQLDGIFIGIGKTRAMQNAMLAASLLVFLPACLTLGTVSNSGLWLSFWLFQGARLAFLAPSAIAVIRKGNPQN